MLLHPLSAMGLWLAASRRPRSVPAADLCVEEEPRPTGKTFAYLRATYPHIPAPLHILVCGGNRNATASFRFYGLPEKWRDVPFCEVGSSLFVPSPEATIISLGKYLDFHRLVYIAGTLCGSFRLDADSPTGLGKRRPLASPQSIAECLEAFPNIEGSMHMRKALPYVHDGAESPPEVFLRMVLGLPYCYGGSAVPDLHANWTLTSFGDKRGVPKEDDIRPDLVAMREGKMASVEYDSDATHLNRRQAARDEARRLAFEGIGGKVVSIRPDHLSNSSYMEKVAREVKKFLGVRIRVPSPKYAERRCELFAMDRSYGQFYV